MKNWSTNCFAGSFSAFVSFQAGELADGGPTWYFTAPRSDYASTAEFPFYEALHQINPQTGPATYRFPEGMTAHFGGYEVAEGVTFTSRSASSQWVGIQGAGTLTDVTISRAQTGFEVIGASTFTRTTFANNFTGARVEAQGVEFLGSTFTGNGFGIDSDYASGTGGRMTRSNLVVTRDPVTLGRSTFTGNHRPLWLRNTDAGILYTDVVDNGSFGVSMWNTSVDVFYRSEVANNGVFGLVGSSGLDVLAGSDLFMQNIFGAAGSVHDKTG